MRPHSFVNLSVFLTLLFFGMNAPALSQDVKSKTIAYSARLVGDESRGRLLLEFNQEPQMEIRYLDKPYRVVLDFQKTRFAFSEDEIVPRGLLMDIRYGAVSGEKSRMVLTMRGAAVLESMEVQTMANDQYRLVLDISSATDDVFETVLEDQKWVEAATVSKKGDRVDLAGQNNKNIFNVVLDAGHGGIDGGAEGRRGTIEKEVTLAFVKELEKALSDMSGLRLVLTRTDDRFLSLSSRVRVAREEHADLFISIHADSIRQRNLRGASIYTLSQKATDAVTASLAESENLTDVIAGLEINNTSDEVTDILIDLARRETKSFSNRAAERVVDAFNGQVRLINNPHRRAGFRVLQAPDVPSILIELGFLSNPADEALLNDHDWRQKATRLLANSIEKYKDTVLAKRR